MNLNPLSEALQASVHLEQTEENPVAVKSGNPLFTSGMIPFAGIIGGFVLAVAVTLILVQSSISESHRATLINQAADNLQVRVNQAQLQLLKQANNIATSIRLTELVTNADDSARGLEEARLRELIPNAVRVRMFKVGEAKVDRDANPPFTFTSLDLVNRAEQGETVYPEAINANGRWVISLAAPIKPPSSDAIRGTLVVYLDTAALVDEIKVGVSGKVSLIQAFNNTPEIEFLSVGEGGDLSFERTLINEHWKLIFMPSANLTEASIGNFVLYLLPALVFLIISLAAVFVGLQKLLGTIKADAVLLQNQMADVINGAFTESAAYQFGEFLELDKTLSRMGKRESDKKVVTPLNVTINPETQPDVEVVEMEMNDDGTFNETEIDPTLEFDEEAELLEGPDVAGIFRAYDIRGVVGETLTAEIVQRIGQAIGTQAEQIGEQSIVVGADGRISSPELLDALIAGLLASGRDVINIGFVPTPLLYFATHNSDASSGVMLTGSHNPANYNGLKVVLDGRTLVAEDIQELYQVYESGEFSTGDGQLTEIDIREDYMDAITDDVVVAQPLKVVIDCGNGIAGDIAPDLISNLGCEVLPLYCDVDGTFPNHHPDPIVPANLEDLILTVKSEKADIGLAFDGDGDRLVAVTSKGEIVWPDRLLMLFAKDVVSRNPGSDVVYDVKCTRHLNAVISGFGGRPIICRSGHSYVKAKMAETDAVLGGEMSGHICFKERWYGFDDALYSAARLLEIVGSQSAGLAELLEEFPVSVSTPEIIIPVAESHKFELIRKIAENADFGDATVTDIDGLRVDFAEGWGLVRASNTTACLTLRFEADTEESLDDIQALFRDRLSQVDAGLNF